MIRLFSKNLNFISNGSVMSIGYKLGATGFTDFLVNVAPRLSLHKLVTDGRIHPARIEEIVKKTTKDISEEIIEIGKKK